MLDETVSIEELRTRVSDLPVALHNGEKTAFARFEQAFSLGSVTIALGEDDCVYDETVFPGVVYQPDSPSATVVVSGDGTIVTIDATDKADAKTAVSRVIETVDELGLIVDDHIPEITTGRREVPFAASPPEVETLGYDDDS